MSSSLEALLAALETRGVRMGLSAMHELLESLGRPHASLPHVLVAGTNGKGSTAALLSSILTVAGYRTGLYTSPHLESPRERLRLNGHSVSSVELEELLVEVTDQAKKECGQLPTYFEAFTAAAFLLFQRRAEIAVLEVGLGGRLDATNIAEPTLSVIAQVGLDHQEILGTSLAEIAREKAGVFRAGRPALAWTDDAGVFAAFDAVAAGHSMEWENVAATSFWVDMAEGCELSTPKAKYAMEIPLPGDHQRRNVALAVRAAEELSGLGWDEISCEAIEQGVARCQWPCRLERVDLRGCGEVLLDAAHNPAAAVALAQYLELNGEVFTLLVGVLGDKKAAEIVEPLAKLAAEVVVTEPESARAMKAEDLAALISREAQTEPRLARALDRALALESPTTVVCGSIYLVGPTRSLLREQFGHPEPAADLPVTRSALPMRSYGKEQDQPLRDQS